MPLYQNHIICRLQPTISLILSPKNVQTLSMFNEADIVQQLILSVGQVFTHRGVFRPHISHLPG